VGAPDEQPSATTATIETTTRETHDAMRACTIAR
jgi:hypothetical protein